jgi:hypothetical protein
MAYSRGQNYLWSGGSGGSGNFLQENFVVAASPRASGCRAARCVSLPYKFPGPALPPLPPFPLFEINDLLEKNSAPGRSQTLPGLILQAFGTSNRRQSAARAGQVIATERQLIVNLKQQAAKIGRPRRPESTMTPESAAAMPRVGSWDARH